MTKNASKRRSPRRRIPNPKLPEVTLAVLDQASTCSTCERTVGADECVRRDPEGVTCLQCARLDSYEFVPARETAVTRLASTYTGTRFAVFRRPLEAPTQGFERIGILATPDAVVRAERRAAENADRKAATRDVRVSPRRPAEVLEEATADV